MILLNKHTYAWRGSLNFSKGAIPYYKLIDLLSLCIFPTVAKKTCISQRNEESTRMEIQLSTDRTKTIIEEIQSYFRNEHDEMIGELKAEMLVDFFIEKLGPKIYNQAIDDANAFIHDKLIDLEGILYIAESS
jgi:uncharacterized protein (DUF2164 family)